MANRHCNIYGPDLSVHEDQGKEVAEQALKCMVGKGATAKEEEGSGSDASKNDLEHLR
jgi:hypothetical protein